MRNNWLYLASRSLRATEPILICPAPVATAKMALKLPEEEGEGGIFAEINITPLTDIFLVLLIIFMVTSTALVEAGQGGAGAGVRVDLPKGTYKEPQAAARRP